MSNFENTVTSSHLELINAVNRSIKSTDFVNNYRTISDIVNQIHYADLYRSASKITEVAQSTYASIHPTLSQLSEIAAKQSAFVEQVASIQNSYIQMLQNSSFYKIQDILQDSSGIITSNAYVINQTLRNIFDTIDDISSEDIEILKESISEKEKEYGHDYKEEQTVIREYIDHQVNQAIEAHGFTNLEKSFNDKRTQYEADEGTTSNSNYQLDKMLNHSISSFSDIVKGEIYSRLIFYVITLFIPGMTDLEYLRLLLIIFGVINTIKKSKD